MALSKSACFSILWWHCGIFGHRTQAKDQAPTVTHMPIDGLIEVLVLLDQLLDIIGLVGMTGLVVLVGRGQEGLPRRHPALGLLAVAVEQLQLQVLVQLDATRYPCPGRQGR